MLLDDFVNSKMFELELEDEKQAPVDLEGNNNFRYSLLKEAYDLQYILEIIDNLESIKEVVKKKHEMLSQLLQLYIDDNDIELNDQDLELLNCYKVNVTGVSNKRKKGRKRVMEQNSLSENAKQTSSQNVETMDDILDQNYNIFTGVEVER